MVYENIYLWEDPLTSGPIFTTVLIVLLSMRYYSFVSVCAYAALFILGTTSGIKVYTCFMSKILKKNINDPLQYYLAYDLELSKEKINEITSSFAKHGNMLILDLRRVFLIEDIFESMKFGLSLWLFTYVGSFINANTIVILAWTGLFTIPKVYMNNKTAIDPLLEKSMYHMTDITNRLNFFTIPQNSEVSECNKDK